MVEAIGKAYKPWIVASVAVLVGSLMLLAETVGAAFFFTREGTPLWVVVLGVMAVLGIGVGFGGFFLMMMVAGWKEWREGRRVQVIPPERE